MRGVDGTQIGVCWPEDSGDVLWLLVRLLDLMDSITPLSTDSIQVGQWIERSSQSSMQCT